MASESSKKPSFVDDSTECSICLDSLQDPTRKVITLGCGHKWHLDCIVQQIKAGQMTAKNDDKRLLFHGIQCGKCNRIFREDDHPDLPKDIVRKTEHLRSKVHVLIDEHNLLEEIASTKLAKEALYQQAMRKYAFYLCSHCKDPYFGGTIECADDLAGQSEATTKLPETRLCPACAPQSQTICQNPTEHGKYLTWKCRYCCKPSTHVCYGNKHFCDDCHSKLSRGPMKAIPCPGDSCPYPKPPIKDNNHNNDANTSCSKFHCNGSSQDCEQVYSCVICDSIGASNGIAHDPFAIEPGSRNFLVNPSGSDGLRGWTKRTSMEWRIEQHSEHTTTPPLLQTPVLGSSHRPPITTNFVSTFRACIMEQEVDLTKVLRLGNTSNTAVPNVVRIEVSARYTGRTDCPSVFRLYATLNDGSVDWYRPPWFQERVTEVLDAPPGGYWERASLEFQLDTTQLDATWNHPVIKVTVIGRDDKFWQGNFGSKVADITVRVVGLNAEEMEALVIPPQDAVEGE